MKPIIVGIDGSQAARPKIRHRSETEIPRGPAAPVLVEASRDAEMMCVGSVGIGRYARSILGSTATELVKKAHCPVRGRTYNSGPATARYQLDCAGRPCRSWEADQRNSPSTRTARSNVGYRIGGSVIPRCASTRSLPWTFARPPLRMLSACRPRVSG
jgi:hypothetical protein